MESEHESQRASFMGNSVSDSVNIMAWLQALLLLSGDIETNPGPPKNRGGPPGGVYLDLDIHRLGPSDCFSGRPKEPTKEEIMAAMKDKESIQFLNCMHP